MKQEEINDFREELHAIPIFGPDIRLARALKIIALILLDHEEQKLKKKKDK